MIVSAAKVTHGLIATLTAERPGVAWVEKIGAAPAAILLPDAASGSEVTATLGANGDALTVSPGGSASVTGSGETAESVLTLAGNAVADETVTIGTRVYTWKATASAANQVKIGATASDSLDNLIAAINGDAGEGTLYGTGTVAHTQVDALAGSGDTMHAYAVAVGTAYNTVATTETMSAGSWNNATLTGGINASAYVGGSINVEAYNVVDADVVDGIEILITAGSAIIEIDLITLPVITAPGVFLLGTSAAITIAEFVITAQEADTAVTFRCLAHDAA